ncbi:hypothetical protein [Ktedonobacter robiniae]|uniref:hypothetical protein n=1 Tax=Ktedonobacter robiniae TaxID=2778365 RepID=UPI0019161806|nr:hypothetical protein [Ktedonobacter robiniae]
MAPYLPTTRLLTAMTYEDEWGAAVSALLCACPGVLFSSLHFFFFHFRVVVTLSISSILLILVAITTKCSKVVQIIAL